VTDLPVACNLIPTELQERRSNVLSKVLSAVTETIELEEGFQYRFRSDGELISELGKLIQLEHRCCPFLTFRLTVEPADGSVLLEMTGPEGTKAFLAEVFAPPSSTT
jgi:hypothetical protein